MSVPMSPGIVCVCSYLSIIGTMASKRARSKDIIGSGTRDAVEQVSMIFPIYEDTKLFMDIEIKMKWMDINDTFLDRF